MAAADERQFNPWEGMTLSSVLRAMGGRLADVGEKIPREIAANLVDLGHEAKRTLLRANPITGPVMAARDIGKRVVGEPEREYQTPTMSPSPYATHSSDPAVKIGAAALDPLNLIGAGLATKLRKGAGAAADALVPKSILKMGESKEAREASAARRAADAAEAEAPVREVPRSAEERAAVAPDKYRQMYGAQGEQAVIDAATAGEHIRPAPSGGGYTGFPRDVKTKRGITRMRKSLDTQLDDAQEALAYAEDPARVGNWYPRARAGIVETTEPWMMDRTVENIGTHSAGVAPESETAFALRHGQSRAMGAPQRGFRGAQQTELDDAVAQDRPAELRFKIGEYRNKMDARRPQDSPFGTNDFRSAQEFGYTDINGAPWTAGVSDQMHPVMDAERALVVDRARKRGQQMTGEKAQEYPWVLGKGEDLFLQNKFAGATDVESKVNALREANKTSADYTPKHTMSMTYETVPGENVGHRPDVLQMSFDEQRKYGPKWTSPPTADDPHPRDAIYKAMRMRQMPPIEGAGSWKGKQQPMTMARPLAYSEVGEVMGLTPAQIEGFKAAELLRGVVGGQSAVAGNLPVSLKARAGKNDLLLERMGLNEAGNPASRLPSADEMRALEQMGAGHNYDVTATNRGALLMPKFGKDVPPPDQLLRDLRKGGGFAQAEAALPGSKAMTAAHEGFYLPALPPERHMGKGVATARALRQLAKAPPEVSRGLSESDEVRRVIRDQIGRDADAGAEGAQVSAALQKTREFLSEKDYNKVVELVRKGMKVPAAMAALGYSLSGMAAEPEASR